MCRQRNLPVVVAILGVVCLALACQPQQATEEETAEQPTMKYGVRVQSGPMDSILVKDYAPGSSLVVPETKVEKARFPVIDIHTHTSMSQIKTPEDVTGLVGGRLKGKKKEYFLALLLDTRNRLIRTAEISIGSLDSSIVHPREVFKEALAASASSVIFVHNHPSGDTAASEDDIKLTGRLAGAGEIMGVDVLDHVIIGGRNYLSMKREGLF